MKRIMEAVVIDHRVPPFKRNYAHADDDTQLSGLSHLTLFLFMFRVSKLLIFRTHVQIKACWTDPAHHYILS